MNAVKLLGVHFNRSKAERTFADFGHMPCIRACGEQIRCTCGMRENFRYAFAGLFISLVRHIGGDIAFVSLALAELNAELFSDFFEFFQIRLKIRLLDKTEICG